MLRWDGPVYRRRPNLVVPVSTPEGAERVLKVCAADLVEPGDYAGERDALRHYASLDRASVSASTPVRAVRLYRADDRLCTLELERVHGVRLDVGWPARRDDIQLTADLARVLRTLWSQPPAAPQRFRPLAQWMQALDEPTTGFDDGIRRRAGALARELRADGAQPVLLHGDLHHENVIAQADGTLVVLDPKGIYGPPGFDLGALLWNPLGAVLDHPHVVAARLDVLAAELDLDRDLVKAWAWVGAILSAAWESDGGPFATTPDYPLAVADLIARS